MYEVRFLPRLLASWNLHHFDAATLPSDKASAIAAQGALPPSESEDEDVFGAVLPNQAVDVVEGFFSSFCEAFEGFDFFPGGVWKKSWVDDIRVEIAQVLNELFAKTFDEVESSHDARCVPGRKGGVIVDGDDAAGLEVGIGTVVIGVSAESIPVVGEEVDEDEVGDLLKDILGGEFVAFGPGEKFGLESLAGGAAAGEELVEELRQRGDAGRLHAEVWRPCGGDFDGEGFESGDPFFEDGVEGGLVVFGFPDEVDELAFVGGILG